MNIVKPPKQPKRIAGFHRTEWSEFIRLPEYLQQVKEALRARERVA